MKKTELKNIIKECVKEVIFEEGVLSGIITEVAVGMSGINSQNLSSPSVHNNSSSSRAKLEESKKEVLAAIKRDNEASFRNNFKNPELFEGTRPIPGEGAKGSPLGGVDPRDPGVDISNIPGFRNWGAVVNKIK